MSRKMKDSGIEWIGEIPEDWETIRVKNLFNVSRGRVISKLETTDDGEYPVYSSQTENDGIFGYIDTYDYFGEALTWTTDGEKAGTVFYRNGKYNCTNICGILQRKQDSIFKTDIKYLFYAIRMVSEENKRPDTNGHKIMSNEMEKLSIPITNYDEQVKIGLTLDKKTQQIENIKNTITEEIETLENYKKSLITEAVTKGLDKNVEMKDSGIEWIGEIPKHWSLNKIKNCADIYGRIGYRGYTQNDIVNEGEGAVSLSPSNMINGEVVCNNNTFITWEKYNESPEIKVKKGDIIMVKTGSSYGKVSLMRNLEHKSTINPQLVVFKTKHIINSYLFYFMNSNYFDYQVEMSVTGGTIPTMSQEKIKNFYILTPEIDEQNKIVDYLEKKCGIIDDSISIKEKQLESLEEYKKSLIYEYVTGKKEV